MTSYKGGLGSKRSAKAWSNKQLSRMHEERKESNKQLHNGAPARDTSKDIVRVKIKQD